MYIPVAGHFFTLIVPEGKLQGTYQSSLLNMDAQHLFITAPQDTESRSAVNLTPGTKVVLDYLDAKDIPCRFETVVDSSPEYGRGGMLALKCPLTIERHQRRENARIPVAWPVTIRSGNLTLTAGMNDLSGGGLSAWVRNEHRIKPGSLVEVAFELKHSGSSSTEITADAEVVSAQSVDEEDHKYLCSVKFVSLEEELRQRIVDLIFHRQKIEIALRNAGNAIAF